MTDSEAPSTFSPVWNDGTRGLPLSVGGEREVLCSYLDWHRATFELKCSGVPEAKLSERTAAPSGLTLHGLMRHLAAVERWWFRIQFAGSASASRPDEPQVLAGLLGARVVRAEGPLAPGDHRQALLTRSVTTGGPLRAAGHAGRCRRAKLGHRRPVGNSVSLSLSSCGGCAVDRWRVHGPIHRCAERARCGTRRSRSAGACRSVGRRVERYDTESGRCGLPSWRCIGRSASLVPSGRNGAGRPRASASHGGAHRGFAVGRSLNG